MPFQYHPPTRNVCKVCEQLHSKDPVAPIIDTYDGRASSANGYPFHDWYNFVLGYTPTFPEYILAREGIGTQSDKIVLDPFVGSGTTQLVCKLKGIPSYGVDANDFMVFAAQQKLNWSIDTDAVSRSVKTIVEKYKKQAEALDWEDEASIRNIADADRPPALDRRYISDRPMVKVSLLRDAISDSNLPDEYHDFFMFAVSAILVPVSNVRYGPGFGIGKAKEDVDVLSMFENKIAQMIKDLSSVQTDQKNTPSHTILGDSRHLSDYVEEDSVSLMITSPPYPGDHEYTKHSKLELIFNGYATDLGSFRVIKKRMIRGSTTNIYREDNERRFIENIDAIKAVTDEIAHRLELDGATSGFEKLYEKLVWEYFGGMARTLSECYKVLKKGGKIALLVSDSHAFKMVHIQTAQLLKEIAEQIGYENAEILLWQMKNSTSHRYQLRENILMIQKP